MQKKNGSVIILSGGKSQRMKFPKPYLLINGKTFVEKIIDEYSAVGIVEIILVMNSIFCEGKWEEYLIKISPKIKLIKNVDPDLGRFHSLKLGVKEITQNEFCFIQPVDNPFVDQEIINSLWLNKKVDNVVSPVFNGKGGHPVLIPETVFHQIRSMEDGDINLKEVFKLFPKFEVKMNDDMVLRNINTPEDYLKLVIERQTA